MAYLIATTENKMRWYKFTLPNTGFELIDALNFDEVSIFPDKQSAKVAAQLVGLKTWRYIKI